MIFDFRSLLNMKKFGIVFILVFIGLICSQCGHPLVDYEYSIKFTNNSTKTINVYESYKYPDTVIDTKKPWLRTLIPGQFFHFSSKNKWEDVLKDKPLIVFVFDKDTIDKYSWDSIRINYKILKRYVISIKDLEQLGYEIKYQ
jgi:hypothetical protein